MEALQERNLYTRKQLMKMFDIKTDSQLNTGIFKLNDKTVWLFVTANKHTPYTNRLDGDVLYWQGQNSGRNDKLIIEHQNRGIELFVFFRKSKTEHSGSGFRFLGKYMYVKHWGANPTNFELNKKH